MIFNKIIIIMILLAAQALFLPRTELAAKTEFSERTGKGCGFCHTDFNGGPLNDTGYAYMAGGYQYPISKETPEKQESRRHVLQKIIRLIVGYIHMIAAFILIGAIFYIHIFIKPASLTTGIPRNERILGVSCLAAISITGIYLTWARIDRFSFFFNNTFGILLFIKIILFATMLTIAIFAITIIHRRMRSEAGLGTPSSDLPAPPEINAGNIAKFNGTEGKPAYFIYDKNIYDVTHSAKWKDGRHFGKHTAGADLSDMIKAAPHGIEVFDRVKKVGTVSSSGAEAGGVSPTRKTFIIMAYANLVIIFLIILCIALWRWGWASSSRNAGGISEVSGKTCVDCHRQTTPGIFSDWEASVHSKVNVECYTCHKSPGPDDIMTNREHLKNFEKPVAIVVSPKKCAGCHPKEFNEYSKSKHANTIEIMNKIDKWLQFGMNNAAERNSGCYACHGTVVEVKEGKPTAGTWPNVGVGRKNPDGSFGSCSSCHTRHKFSIIEARKPEACGQCHLGPDHPQFEIYNESKHGAVYHAEGGAWNWAPGDNRWIAGRDYRTPTCSACHMSAGGGAARTHDVTERLSWETQSPFTIRPSEFKAFPAQTDWQKERNKMTGICAQCHSRTWADGHYANLDAVISNYNDNYYTPAENIINDLYAKGLLSKAGYFDEPLEWEFYELWHHEGRRARMGAAMMAPDYAWWHGFYELKHRLVNLQRDANILRASGRSYIYYNFPGKFPPAGNSDGN